MRALLIIDIQNDFLPGGSLAVKEGDTIIPIINNIQKNYNLIVATQDWHPQNHKSFASQHENKSIFDQIKLNGLPQTLWPDHCIQGTKGAEFTNTLNQDKIEAIFRKGMDTNIDSYSGFFDNGKLKSTGLTDYLRGKKVTDIDICGLAADFCVYFSAMDALESGFNTRIIENATKAINFENFEKLKINFLSKKGEIIHI